ncbi:hypothetical protein J6590_075819 [Homalodisca vitripennis]|nr:hypothetical protein J6590_075819 [Homalodisca vitripennis]
MHSHSETEISQYNNRVGNNVLTCCEPKNIEDSRETSRMKITKTDIRILMMENNAISILFEASVQAECVANTIQRQLRLHVTLNLTICRVYHNHYCQLFGQLPASSGYPTNRLLVITSWIYWELGLGQDREKDPTMKCPEEDASAFNSRSYCQ